MNRTYMCIDLKSFYASAECSFRGLDPLTTNLVVADVSRTEKTICLAVSPSLKEYGIGGRARLFEVVEAVRKINLERLKKNHYRPFRGKSSNKIELLDPTLELDYIAARPQMAKYIEVSTKVYKVFLRYIAPEDIHVYSIDESFMDVTDYLKTYKLSAHELAIKIVKDVLKETGITATCGIGTNMYLAKIAMDIVAKHEKADKDGVRIASLDEESYKKILWTHRPLTDFWRIGAGISRRLESLGIFTMGDIARCSIDHEDILYNQFGINAEILIDHAWGIEPVTIKDVKNYKPQVKSNSVGQVLHEPYDYKRGRVAIKEMAQELSMQLFKKGIVTNNVSISLGYDISSTEGYEGEIDTDYLGRKIPKGSHGGVNLGEYTNSSIIITKAVEYIYDSIFDRRIMVRRLNVGCGDTKRKIDIDNKEKFEQLSLFDDPIEHQKEKEEKEKFLEKEARAQEAILKIKNKFGKNSIIKGLDLEDGATQIERNQEIGGHKA